VPQLRGEVIARVVVVPRLLPEVLRCSPVAGRLRVFGGPVWLRDDLVFILKNRPVSVVVGVSLLQTGRLVWERLLGFPHGRGHPVMRGGYVPSTGKSSNSSSSSSAADFCAGCSVFGSVWAVGGFSSLAAALLDEAIAIYVGCDFSFF